MPENLTSESPAVTAGHSNARILGEWGTIDELVAVLRNRADELKVTRNAIDEGTGLPAGYAGKILTASGTRKNMGCDALELIITALGMRMVAIENAAAVRRFTNHLQKRKIKVHAGTRMLAQKPLGKRAFLAFKGNTELARRLRAHQLIHQPRNKRKAIASHAAQARWAKHRANVQATKDRRGEQLQRQ